MHFRLSIIFCKYSQHYDDSSLIYSKRFVRYYGFNTRLNSENKFSFLGSDILRSLKNFVLTYWVVLLHLAGTLPSTLPISLQMKTGSRKATDNLKKKNEDLFLMWLLQRKTKFMPLKMSGECVKIKSRYCNVLNFSSSTDQLVLHSIPPTVAPDSDQEDSPYPLLPKGNSCWPN